MTLLFQHSTVQNDYCPQRWHGLFAAVVFMAMSCQGQAFEFNGNKWPGAETEFYVAINGVSASSISWDTAFIAAMNDWSVLSNFKFTVRREFRDPCRTDRLNGVDFTDNVCGSQYGSNVLGVTLRSFSNEILGPARISEADILISKAIPYDIFDGNLVQSGRPRGVIDFRRVALHELGHALGLDHSTDPGAIMLLSIGNTFRPNQDDISAVNTLYGGLSACPIQTVSFGKYSDELQAGDCTVQKLTVGGSDNSLIDVRRLQLDRETFVQVDMRSPTLDSVIVLADSALRFLSVNDNGGGNCDASISQTLPAGTYYVISNTWDQATVCGKTTGPYTLSISFRANASSSLGGVNSLLGGTASASFTGGIVANNSAVYGSRFKPTDSLDIAAKINVDPQHQGRPGFLVVAVLFDNGTLQLKNAQGQFVSYAGLPAPFIKAASKVLLAQEDVEIATDLIPAALNVQSINVNFLVGYGLDSNPLELFYHQTPINLLVEP